MAEKKMKNCLMGWVPAGKYCCNRGHRTIISSIKVRCEEKVILIVARTGLFVIYGEQAVQESHLG